MPIATLDLSTDIIGVGAAANDGTGDNLRLGGQKIDDAFSRIQTAVNAAIAAINGGVAPVIFRGPYAGATNRDLMNAVVKLFNVSWIFPLQCFYLSYLKCGVSNLGNYDYEVRVGISNAAGTTGVDSLGWTASVGALKTGVEWIALHALNSSGISGYIMIDWGVTGLGHGTYTMTNYNAGGLFATNTGKTNTPGGGGGGGVPTDWTALDISTGNTTPNGSQEIYLMAPTGADKDAIIVPFADLKGNIHIKNLSDSHNVRVTSDGSFLFDNGTIYIYIQPGKDATIYPYVDADDSSFKLAATGNYIDALP